MRRIAFAFPVVAALFAVGCSPSPEEVCTHMGTIDPKANDSMCTFKMQEKKDLHRDQYKKLAPCIMEAKDKDAFNKCLEQYQK